ncbi:glycosyltransferase family 39 protein [Streptomyces sp. TRM S81-3]|uniref:Glycosyltransferase family 39 protein n=2 Tax=Streptomyces griseicoloratus TaxID=2752516 RepID=A0A926L8B1_9ACTN|nr:glycosyltransferase family 39 protein [Streptomyces griseicoloratus]MBD0423239.1 glycosyltransferase family 39 protein [Streptomyces griseicoloratus]
MLAIGLWGVGRGGMWRDEAVTFQVARRAVPQIWRLLHGVDAVHGLYYLLMHAVLAVDPAPGEVVLRLPSVCGAAATAGLVAALGTRLARPRVGLWAGLLYAVTPLAGHYAQEGRSYALVAAGAAGATLLLVRALGGAARAWWPYGLVVAVTCLLHELAVLVLCAHAVTLALVRAGRAVWWGWGRAAVAAGVVLAPLVIVSRAQAGQVGWLPVPGWGSAERVLRGFVAAPAGPLFWGCVALAVLGLGRRRLAVVAGPLAVVPPALLMGISQVRPVYDDRYVLYALAGAPLLAAAGAERVAGAVGRLWPGGRRPVRARPVVALAGVVAVALAFLQHLPLHRVDRTPATRADNLAAVSALAAREIRPGDAVLFLPSIARRAALAYPAAFAGARDLALSESGPKSGTLYGREVGPAELRRRLAGPDRVWVVVEPYALRGDGRPSDPADRAKLMLVRDHFALREEHTRPGATAGATLRLYVRVGAAARPEPARRTAPGPPGPRRRGGVPTGRPADRAAAAGPARPAAVSSPDADSPRSAPPVPEARHRRRPGASRSHGRPARRGSSPDRHSGCSQNRATRSATPGTLPHRGHLRSTRAHPPPKGGTGPPGGRADGRTGGRADGAARRTASSPARPSPAAPPRPARS